MNNFLVPLFLLNLTQPPTNQPPTLLSTSSPFQNSQQHPSFSNWVLYFVYVLVTLYIYILRDFEWLMRVQHTLSVVNFEVLTHPCYHLFLYPSYSILYHALVPLILCPQTPLLTSVSLLIPNCKQIRTNVQK